MPIFRQLFKMMLSATLLAETEYAFFGGSGLLFLVVLGVVLGVGPRHVLDYSA